MEIENFEIIVYRTVVSCKSEEYRLQLKGYFWQADDVQEALCWRYRDSYGYDVKVVKVVPEVCLIEGGE